MDRVVSELHESASISVLDDTDIVYVVRVPARRIRTVTIAVRTRLPAYVTSMGRVLLASLPRDALDRRLARISIERHTAHTIRSGGSRSLTAARPAASARPTASAGRSVD